MAVEGDKISPTLPCTSNWEGVCSCSTHTRIFNTFIRTQIAQIYKVNSKVSNSLFFFTLSPEILWVSSASEETAAAVRVKEVSDGAKWLLLPPLFHPLLQAALPSLAWWIFDMHLLLHLHALQLGFVQPQQQQRGCCASHIFVQDFLLSQRRARKGMPRFSSFVSYFAYFAATPVHKPLWIRMFSPSSVQGNSELCWTFLK